MKFNLRRQISRHSFSTSLIYLHMRIAIRHLEQLNTYNFADGLSEEGSFSKTNFGCISLNILIEWSKENERTIR